MMNEQKITAFLMFSGQAEAAMNSYTSLFDQSKIISITRYGANEAGKEGSVLQASFSLMGQTFMCIDSSVKHDFAFTPAISFYVTCDTDDQINQFYAKLTQGGAVLMPLDAYPFSEKFAWIQDQFGVSWQLNLAKS